MKPVARVIGIEPVTSRVRTLNSNPCVIMREPERTIKRGGNVRKNRNLSSDEMVGIKVNHLTFEKYSHTNEIGKAFWRFRCDCGKEIVTRAGAVLYSITKSCGCARFESLKTHRKSGTPQFNAWLSMVGRCRNPNHGRYKDYGARGITVCERWMKYENFLADMGERPRKMTLERKDNNGPYSPENCRWASYSDQMRNRRDTVLLTFEGRSMIAEDWRKELGFSRWIFRDRLNKCEGNLENLINKYVRNSPC